MARVRSLFSPPKYSRYLRCWFRLLAQKGSGNSVCNLWRRSLPNCSFVYWATFQYLDLCSDLCWISKKASVICLLGRTIKKVTMKDWKFEKFPRRPVHDGFFLFLVKNLLCRCAFKCPQCWLPLLFLHFWKRVSLERQITTCFNQLRFVWQELEKLFQFEFFDWRARFFCKLLNKLKLGVVVRWCPKSFNVSLFAMENFGRGGSDRYHVKIQFRHAPKRWLRFDI